MKKIIIFIGLSLVFLATPGCVLYPADDYQTDLQIYPPQLIFPFDWYSHPHSWDNHWRGWNNYSHPRIGPPHQGIRPYNRMRPPHSGNRLFQPRFHPPYPGGIRPPHGRMRR